MKLFDWPATGKHISKRKAPSVNRIKVNHTIADQRYYFHRRLKKYYPVDGTLRMIDVPYKSFEEIPQGPAKYYIIQLLKLGYNVQYKLL